MTDVAKGPEGIPCPCCKRTTGSWVKDSRGAKNAVRRRRECVCGEKFTTLEVLASDVDPVATLEDVIMRTDKLFAELSRFKSALDVHRKPNPKGGRRRLVPQPYCGAERSK